VRHDFPGSEMDRRRGEEAKRLVEFASERGRDFETRSLERLLIHEFFLRSLPRTVRRLSGFGEHGGPVGTSWRKSRKEKDEPEHEGRRR